METTGSRYTIADWAIGLSVFAVFTVVALYAISFTLPTGWTVTQWSLFLLCIVWTAQLILAARKRRRQFR